MRKSFYAFLTLALIVSCNSEENPTKEIVTPEISSTSEVKDIEILFNEKQFSDPKMMDLLHEINICDMKQTDLNNASRPACDPKFFHLLPFIENEPLENAFLLVIRSGVHDWPLRRVLVYQREQGKLVLVNTFVAHLIGMKKSSTGHDDLILQFFDEYENRLECLYRWKENRYQYVSVEKIEGSKIKKALQDSMNVEIAKVIRDNKMAS
jgi:hypothetical protein